jgi:hypothetical protein
MFGFGSGWHSRSAIFRALPLALICTCISPSVSAGAAEGLSFRCEFPKTMDSAVSRSACEAVRSSVTQRLGQVGGRPGGSGAVVLEVTRSRANSLSARLRWKVAGAMGWSSGPIVTTVVSDATLNDDILTTFARRLVEASRF